MRARHPSNRFIQSGITRPGSLHRQLRVPDGTALPKTFLEEIKATPIGKMVSNPTKTGIREIKVTRLVKQRAVLALSLERFSEERFGHSTRRGGTEG